MLRSYQNFSSDAWDPKVFWDSFDDFDNGTADLIVLVGLRFFVTTFLTWLAVKVGTPRKRAGEEKASPRGAVRMRADSTATGTGRATTVDVVLATRWCH